MNFDHILLRLKQELGVPTDKEVAELLGLSKTAFAERKRRNVFPKEKLFALTTQKPDLVIDIYYVLTGERLRPEQGGERFKSWAELQGKAGSEESANLLAIGMLEHAEKRKNREQKIGELLLIVDNLNEEDFDLVIRVAANAYNANVLPNHTKK